MTQPVVLIVGAHHEEVEAEFPNLAAALSLAGCRVVILNPIGGWNWTAIRSLEGDGRARTIADATAAAAALGCEKVIWDYPVALVPEHQGELKHRLAAFFCDLQPDILLMHWPKDGHPDHRAVANLTRHVASAGSTSAMRSQMACMISRVRTWEPVHRRLRAMWIRAAALISMA